MAKKLPCCANCGWPKEMHKVWDYRYIYDAILLMTTGFKLSFIECIDNND